MTGGDFPAWADHPVSAVPGAAQASPANLVDRRGECVQPAASTDRTCFVEKAIRGSRKADLVIANHALGDELRPLSTAPGVRARGSKGDAETNYLKRIIFDEGHHLFEIAADSAFSAALSGTPRCAAGCAAPKAGGRRAGP